MSDDVLDRIDEIVPPGVDVTPLPHAYQEVVPAARRRRPLLDRAARV